jgi:hypothetical protein
MGGDLREVQQDWTAGFLAPRMWKRGPSSLTLKGGLLREGDFSFYGFAAAVVPVAVSGAVSGPVRSLKVRRLPSFAL